MLYTAREIVWLAFVVNLGYGNIKLEQTSTPDYRCSYRCSFFDKELTPAFAVLKQHCNIPILIESVSCKIECLKTQSDMPITLAAEN